MLKMICTREGYEIRNENGATLMSFSITAGQPIYTHAYCDSRFPEARSIFLQGVLAAYGAMKNG